MRTLFEFFDRLDFRRLRASDLKSEKTTAPENTNGTKRKAQTSQVRRMRSRDD